jgi:hypothetical protein
MRLGCVVKTEGIGPKNIFTIITQSVVIAMSTIS